MASNHEEIGRRVAEALAAGEKVWVLYSGNRWYQISRIEGEGGVMARTMGRGWVPWTAVLAVHVGDERGIQELEELGS